MPFALCHLPYSICFMLFHTQETGESYAWIFWSLHTQETGESYAWILWSLHTQETGIIIIRKAKVNLNSYLKPIIKELSKLIQRQYLLSRMGSKLPKAELLKCLSLETVSNKMN